MRCSVDNIHHFNRLHMEQMTALATMLSGWVTRPDLKAECLAWADFYAGQASEKPSPVKLPIPRKDSPFDLFSKALFCLRMGHATLATGYIARVSLYNKKPLDRFPTRPDFTPPPQPNRYK